MKEWVRADTIIKIEKTIYTHTKIMNPKGHISNKRETKSSTNKITRKTNANVSNGIWGNAYIYPLILPLW